MPHRLQTFDSNGPNVKIRGNAYQVYERYQALAREAQTSGDRVAAENLYQHAEHYFRIMAQLGEQSGQNQGQPRPMIPDDGEVGVGDGEMRSGEEAQVQMHAPIPPPAEPEYRRELEDGMRPPERREDEQPPPF